MPPLETRTQGSGSELGVETPTPSAETPRHGRRPSEQRDTNAGASAGQTARRVVTRRGTMIWLARIAILAIVLAGWQFTPQIPGIRNVFSFEDPFFISSPTRVVHELYLLATGAENSTVIWGPLAHTVVTALIGTTVAVLLGALAGLVVSSSPTFARIVQPYITFLNAIPRVAIVPIIVLLVRSSAEADALAALTVVFFLAFYNALEGSLSVPIEMLQNGQLLGASPARVVWKVRWPYALAWTFVALPNAIAFGLTGTVTTELFTGGEGLGNQLMVGIDNANANLLFAIVVIVAVVGVVLVLGAAWLRRLVLPWWESNEGAA